MKRFFRNKQSGVAALALAIAVTAASAGMNYLTSSSLSQNTKLQRTNEARLNILDLNSSVSQRIAQLIQANQITVDLTSNLFEDGLMTETIANGGYNGSYGGTNNDDRSRVIFRECLRRPTPTGGNFTAAMEADAVLVNNWCESNANFANMRVEHELSFQGPHQFESGPTDNRTVTDYLKFQLTSYLPNETRFDARVAKNFLIKMSAPSVSDGSECPYLDPTLNSPGSTYTQPHYLQYHRAFVGWTRIGVRRNADGSMGLFTDNGRLNQSNPFSPIYYNPIQFRSYMTADAYCQHQWCNYYQASDENFERHSWMVRLHAHNLPFVNIWWEGAALQLHVPRTNRAGCFWVFRANRRPAGGNPFNGCFKEGTKIRMADMSTKAVEDIIAGDKVYNPKTKKPVEVARTTVGPETKPLIEISLFGDRTVTVSDEHVFETDMGLKQAKDLNPSQHRILDSDRRYREFTKKVLPFDPSNVPDVYNLHVAFESTEDRDHFIVADGVVTGDLYLQEKLGGVSPEKLTASSKDHRALQLSLRQAAQKLKHSQRSNDK